MKETTKTQIWYKGGWRIYQDMSLEEQEEFWKEIEENAQRANKKECVLLKMYGNGEKFNQPVWYSCGKCENCQRIPKKE